MRFAEGPGDAFPQPVEGVAAFRQIVSVGLEFMHHVFPCVQPYLRALGGEFCCKVPDHVDEDLLTPGLQVDRSKVFEILMDRRELFVAEGLAALEPGSELQGHVALYEVETVIAELALAAPPDVGPRAQAKGQRGFGQMSLGQFSQGHQGQVAAGRVATKYEGCRVDAFVDEVGIGCQAIVELCWMRVFRGQSIVRRKYRDSQGVRQAGGKMV